MNITLEMILTKFFNEYPDAHPVQPVSPALMERSMLGIQLLPRHCNTLPEEFLYVTDQIYYSAKIQIKRTRANIPVIKITDICYVL